LDGSRDHVWNLILYTFKFSDIKVSVRCDGVKKLALATTENDGSFKVDLPLDHTKPSSSVNNCLAKLLGGPVQLYVSRENQVSQIIKGKDQNSYTISTSLSFRTSCPLTTKCKGGKQVGSSKTVDLPLPPEWGLAPSSYYVPFFPIIGIPWSWAQDFKWFVITWLIILVGDNRLLYCLICYIWLL